MSARSLLLLVASSALAPPAAAQISWLSFAKENNRIVQPGGGPATHITADTDEKDFAWGDLDQDGWTDVAMVRKTPVSFPGKRVNYLLMNEKVGGVRKLVDRTSEYATAADFPGDLGFQTPTDDRDVELGDLNGDGWLDLLTSTTDLSNENGSAFKHLTHPRVYVNLGDDLAGDWQGLRFENGRIPQLMAGAVNGTVRFCDAALGDVDGDGDLDVYFNDYDLTENGFPEPAGSDLNDRLLLNDGAGYFTDSVFANIKASYLACEFGTACEIVDFNMDGRNDVARITTLFGTRAIQCIYNDANPAVVPNGNGKFDVFQANAFTGSPYHVAAGDLNNDGRPDLVNSDDGLDGYQFNTATDPVGQVTWSSKKNFVFASGSNDQGFGGSNEIVDLNVDGWNDVFIADVDVDLLGCDRRSKFFRNTGGTPGATNIVLQEQGGSGYFGATGLLPGDMTGGFDAAFPDLDRDGDPDLVFGECNGTTLWLNQTNPVACGENLGFGGPGDLALAVCGQPLYTGNAATVSLTNGTPGGTAYFFVALSSGAAPVALLGGTLAAFPIAVSFALPIGGAGSIAFPVAGGVGEVQFDLQVLATDPTQTLGVEFSNTVRVSMHP